MSELGTILPSAKWYQYYINPFELMGLQDKYASADDINSNQIKKLKKLLLQEIELEDGEIAWMPNLNIDKAKALNVCNELHNKNLLELHLSVFNDNRLLNFLSRGDCTCFLADLENAPLVFKQHNKTFNANTVLILINQFNLVIAEIIKSKQFTIIKQLFNCRNWVPSSKLHLLTESTTAILNKHLNKLEIILNKAKNQDISWDMIDKILYKDALFNIINELPQDLFKEQQERILKLLNLIAVTTGNRKANFALEIKILKTAQQFSFKSKKYDKLIASNLEIIQNNSVELSLNNLAEILNKAKYSDISWKMIDQILYKDELLRMINELPAGPFWKQHNIMLRLLNAIAVTITNKGNLTLAIKILKKAEQYNCDNKEIEQLIAKNLQFIKKNQLSNDYLKGNGWIYFILIATGILLLKTCS